MNQALWRNKVFGLVLVLMGIMICIYSFMSYQMTCAVKSPGIAQHCVLKDHLFHLYRSNIVIGDISGAKIQSIYNMPTKNNVMGSYTYHVLLITPQKPHGVYLRNLSTSDHDNAIQLAHVINDYVSQGTTNTIKLPNVFPWWFMLFPFLLIPAGIMLYQREC